MDGTTPETAESYDVDVTTELVTRRDPVELALDLLRTGALVVIAIALVVIA